MTPSEFLAVEKLRRWTPATDDTSPPLNSAAEKLARRPLPRGRPHRIIAGPRVAVVPVRACVPRQ